MKKIHKIYRMVLTSNLKFIVVFATIASHGVLDTKGIGSAIRKLDSGNG